jgi:hypothetical protein
MGALQRRLSCRGKQYHKSGVESQHTTPDFMFHVKQVAIKSTKYGNMFHVKHSDYRCLTMQTALEGHSDWNSLVLPITSGTWLRSVSR